MTAEIIKHEGEFMPVPADAMVQYRTVNAEGLVSHWHHRQQAGLMNWTSTFPPADRTSPNRSPNPKPLFLGRIYDYAVVPS